MKQTFSSNQEVCHVWASQSQDCGNAGNISFSGDVIYSYSTVMGRIMGDVVLLNRSHYSVTTSTHQGLMAAAVGHLKSFNVVSCTPNHEKNVVDYAKRIKDSFGCYFRAKSRKHLIFDENHELYRELLEYCKHFKISPPNVKGCILAVTDNAVELQKKRYDKENRQEKATIKNDVEAAKLDWLACKSNNTFVTVGGKSYYFDGVLLRANGTEVETSGGAKVPLKEARILYKAIKAGKPVHGFKVGYYTVTSLNGSLKIGCHTISLKEVDRFAKAMNW